MPSVDLVHSEPRPKKADGTNSAHLVFSERAWKPATPTADDTAAPDDKPAAPDDKPAATGNQFQN
ncbi:hypothetical protein J7E70_30270 [Variovorax paradoxus]|nr:hypothetical protein [Variovorax paradoxus]MBT2304708.1 hypothetical protein [Variovorax paradoxus]